MLCLIEVSKDGLSEEELKAILHIDSATWSPMFFAMASFILDRAGLYRCNAHNEIVQMITHFILYFFIYLPCSSCFTSFLFFIGGRKREIGECLLLRTLVSTTFPFALLLSDHRTTKQCLLCRTLSLNVYLTSFVQFCVRRS